jgi:hypothetical protein
LGRFFFGLLALCFSIVFLSCHSVRRAGAD